MTKKIKKPVRKPAKKTAKPRAKPKAASKQEKGVMAIIPYKDIIKPEVYKGKYTLIPTPFTELQIKAIIAPTPPNIIKQRPGRGGGRWDYVPGWWFKKKLNFVFGFSHDFEILGERVDGDFITVKGRLTAKNPKTGQIIATKTDFGGATIKYLKDKAHTPANYLDISNDFKAAATDALKRCAVQFGFAMDIYGKSESIDEGYQVQNSNPPAPVTYSTKAPDEKSIEMMNLMQYATDSGAPLGKEKQFIEQKLGQRIDWTNLTKKDLIMIKVNLMSKIIKR
jgi:hypothetical protein